MNDTKYIEYFNNIEQYLKNKNGSNHHISFTELLKNLSHDPTINYYYTQLHEHSTLRNVIVHKKGTEFFAFPSDYALKSIEKIHNELLRPKKIIDIIKHAPLVLKPEDNIINVLKIINKEKYSQFPVYNDKEFLGLLTTNALSFWLSHNINDEGEIIENMNFITVGDVIKFNESVDIPEFIGRETTVIEFIQLVNKSSSSVFLMTEDGAKNKKPLRIITQDDYVKIISSIK